MISQHAFGSRLRTQRERRGVALAAIADRTKLKLSLLEALERGDLSQWPKGLFRRAYLRGYAAGVGMNADALLLEVEQLFPEDGEPARAPKLPADAEPMRLSFPAASELTSHRVVAGMGAATVEWAAVVIVGLAVGMVAGANLLAAAGVAALIYYPVSIAVTGRTLSSPRIRMAWNRLRARPQTVPDTTEQAPLYLVGRPAPPPHSPTQPIGLQAIGVQSLGGQPLGPAQLVGVRGAEDVPAQQTAVS